MAEDYSNVKGIPSSGAQELSAQAAAQLSSTPAAAISAELCAI